MIRNILIISSGGIVIFSKAFWNGVAQARCLSRALHPTFFSFTTHSSVLPTTHP
jgi:hypothetical protein